MKRPSEIFIVAGGPSLRGFKWESLKNRITIAVNAAILDVPDPNYFITIDYSFLKKIANIPRVLQQTTATRVFVANMNHPFMKESNGVIVDTRFNLVYDLSLFDLVIKTRNIQGIGHTFREFCTGLNSGYCAFQLALLLRPQKIYLLGVDLTVQKSTHYHDRYCNRRSSFEKALLQYQKYWEIGLNRVVSETDVKVISCSPISPLNQIIPFVPYQDALK